MTPAQSLKKTKAVDKKNTKPVISVVMFLRLCCSAGRSGITHFTQSGANRKDSVEILSLLELKMYQPGNSLQAAEQADML